MKKAQKKKDYQPTPEHEHAVDKKNEIDVLCIPAGSTDAD